MSCDAGNVIPSEMLQNKAVESFEKTIHNFKALLCNNFEASSCTTKRFFSKVTTAIKPCSTETHPRISILCASTAFQIGFDEVCYKNRTNVQLKTKHNSV